MNIFLTFFSEKEPQNFEIRDFDDINEEVISGFEFLKRVAKREFGIEIRLDVGEVDFTNELEQPG